MQRVIFIPFGLILLVVLVLGLALGGVLLVLAMR